jgi:hypothetical protein
MCRICHNNAERSSYELLRSGETACRCERLPQFWRNSNPLNNDDRWRCGACTKLKPKNIGGERPGCPAGGSPALRSG